MKKVLSIITLILALTLCVGAVGCGNENEFDAKNLKYEIEFLPEKEEFKQGEVFAFRVRAGNTTELIGIKYKVNSEEYVDVSVSKGPSKQMSDPLDSNLLEVDTGVQIFETGGYAAGYYVLQFYAVDINGGVYELNEDPYLFQIKE